MLVNIECPVEVLDYQLYKSKSSGKTYLSLTFNNLSAKRVKGLKATIYCFDQFGDPIHSAEENHFESKIQFKEVTSLTDPFDTDEKIALDNFPNTRKIEVDITKVLFEDQTIWDKNDTELEKVELEEIQNPKQLSFIKSIAGEDAKYFARKTEGRWTCVCGRLNYDYMPTCQRCRKERDEVLSKYSNEETINQNIEVYEKEQEELRKKEQEEREQQLERTKKKAKKIAKFSSIVAAVLLVIGVSFFGFMTKFTFSIENYRMLQDKDNALIQAVKDENLKDVEFLLESGADIDFQNSDEERSLVEAIKLGNNYIVQLLLSNGASQNNLDSEGNSAIHLAIENDQIETLKFLIETNMDINQKNKDQEKILYTAISRANPEIMNYLLTKDVDLYDLDAKGNNVLQVVLSTNNMSKDLVNSLIEKEFDFFNVNNNGETIINNALENGHFELLYFLEEKSIVSEDDIHSIAFEGLENSTQNIRMRFFSSLKTVLESLDISSGDVQISNFSPWNIEERNGVLEVTANDIATETLEKLNIINASEEVGAIRSWAENLVDIVDFAAFLYNPDNKNWSISVGAYCSSFHPDSFNPEDIAGLTGSCGYGFPIVNADSSDDNIKIFFDGIEARELASEKGVLDVGELKATINDEVPSIDINGVMLGMLVESVKKILGDSDKKVGGMYEEFVYVLEDSAQNLNISFYDQKVDLITFDISLNTIDSQWYQELGEPFDFDEISSVSVFYQEGSEQLLMFKFKENIGYLLHADNNFYYNHGMEDKMW